MYLILCTIMFHFFLRGRGPVFSQIGLTLSSRLPYPCHVPVPPPLSTQPRPRERGCIYSYRSGGGWYGSNFNPPLISTSINGNPHPPRKNKIPAPISAFCNCGARLKLSHNPRSILCSSSPPSRVRKFTTSKSDHTILSIFSNLPPAASGDFSTDITGVSSFRDSLFI